MTRARALWIAVRSSTSTTSTSSRSSTHCNGLATDGPRRLGNLRYGNLRDRSALGGQQCSERRRCGYGWPGRRLSPSVRTSPASRNTPRRRQRLAQLRLSVGQSAPASRSLWQRGTAARTWASATRARMPWLAPAAPTSPPRSTSRLPSASGAHFEFRADSFNTFNHTQFNGIQQQRSRKKRLWFRERRAGPERIRIRRQDRLLTATSTGARQAIPAAPLFLFVLNKFPAGPPIENERSNRVVIRNANEKLRTMTMH